MNQRRKKVCFTCGGNPGPEYKDNPCPECGATYKSNVIESVVEDKKVVESSKRLLIPEYYVGKIFTKEVFIKEHQSEANKVLFRRYLDNLLSVQNQIVNGKLPKTSGIIIADPKYGKMTWAYSCMQLALAGGFTVGPLIDTFELRRFMMKSIKYPTYKLYGKFDLDSYLSSDILFVTVTKNMLHEVAYEDMLTLLDIRSRMNLPTFFISRFDVRQFTSKDFNEYFNKSLDYDGVNNSLKYPAIVQYRNLAEGEEM